MKHYRILILGIFLAVALNIVMYRWNNRLESALLPRTTPYLKEISEHPFISMAFDSQNRCWTISRSEVNEYEGDSLIRSYSTGQIGAFQHAESEYATLSIYVDLLDRPWVVVDNNLSVLDNGIWKTYTSDFLKIESGGISTLGVDKLNRIWIGTYYEGGVRIIDGNSVTVLTVQNSRLAGNDIGHIAIDNAGRIWIATLGGGINVVEREDWQTYSKNNSPLLSDYVNTIAFDGQNRAWIGTHDGLNILDGEYWQNFTPKNSDMLSGNVLIIKFTNNSRAWLGDDVMFDGQNWGFYFIPSKIFEETWHQTYFDNEGNLILSPFAGGVIDEVKLVRADVRLVSRFGLFTHNMVASGGLLFFSILLLEILAANLLSADKIVWKNLLFSGASSALFLWIYSYDPLLFVVSNIGFVVSICLMTSVVISLLINRSRKTLVIGIVIGWILGLLVGIGLFGISLVSLMGPY